MQKKYDWDAWFDSKEFTLVQGKDFSCSPESMAQQIRNAAMGRQVRVSVLRAATDKLHVQVRD